jgi:hypothetical protein
MLVVVALFVRPTTFDDPSYLPLVGFAGFVCHMQGHIAKMPPEERVIATGSSFYRFSSAFLSCQPSFFFNGRRRRIQIVIERYGFGHMNLL